VADCCRCRCRPVRNVDDPEHGKVEAEDDLCMECHDFRNVRLLQALGDAEHMTDRDLANMFRTIVATFMPTRRELMKILGPRHAIAEHFIRRAAKELVAAAGFIASDGWVPPTSKPEGKPWIERK